MVSWLVCRWLLYPRLRVRPWPKSVDFDDAENRQRPCVPLPLGSKLGIKIICGDWYPPLWYRTKKRYQLLGNVLDNQSRNELLAQFVFHLCQVSVYVCRTKKQQKAIGDGPRNFEPWSREEDGYLSCTSCPNFHITPWEGSESRQT
ncbi:hypothetical protein TNCV_3350681 [Trichonephila clavipes]|nr:hypothetical protein TNCV_3350681 [Trichonephila clavipes]